MKMPPTSSNLHKMIMAHRGGSWEQPENTFQAFKYALKNGAQFLETDVCMTKDGVIAVCHDQSLSRLCGVESFVKETNFANLPKFKREMPMHFSKLNKDCEFLNYKRTDEDQDGFSTLEEVF